MAFIPAIFAAASAAAAPTAAATATAAAAGTAAEATFLGLSASTWSILSAGSSAASALMGGIQQKNMADYNARVMNQNAKIERQQAVARESQQRREANQVLGLQRAAFAQSGAGLDGSAADVMQQSATNAELDAMMIRYEGDLRARGMQEQARQERFSGRTALTNGYMNAAGSILSGIGDYNRQQADAQYRSEMLRRMS